MTPEEEKAHKNAIFWWRRANYLRDHGERLFWSGFVTGAVLGIICMLWIFQR